MRYVARRLVHAVLILIAISLCSFALLQCAPGSFLDDLRMNPRISAQTINGLRIEYGLNEPFPIRYARWIRSTVKGDMGFSFAYNGSVGPLVCSRARNTLLLSASSTLIAWVLGLPIGVWSASRKGRWDDRLFGAATSTMLAVPDLLLFLVLLLLAARTGWFPTGGIASPGFESLSVWGKSKDLCFHLFLPSFGLAVVTMPILVRHARAAMIESIEAPFMRAARGHGISETRLLWRYALPAASNPLVSLLGLSIAGMVSASAIVEVVLSWPGLGPLVVQAVMTRDVYLVLGAVMLASTFLVVGNLIADLLLFASDPRIRVE